MGQPFQVQAADNRHHGHQQLALFTGRQQGLEHLRRIEPEFFRRFQPVGGGLGVMFVTVYAMFGPNLFQQIQCGGHDSSRLGGRRKILRPILGH
ncbi:hypothetical protein D3C78_1439440 [compost metagenome]